MAWIEFFSSILRFFRHVLKFIRVEVLMMNAMKIVEFADCVVRQGGCQVKSKKKGVQLCLRVKIEFPALSPPLHEKDRETSPRSSLF